MPTPKPFACWTARLLLPGALLLLVACGSPQQPPTSAILAAPLANAASGETELQSPSGAEVQQLLPPPTPGEETPLLSPLADVPTTAVLTQTLSRTELAAMLHTTVEQLEYTNVGLDDPVSAGTLVVVPTGYRVSEDETLADIAASMGIAEAELRKSNGLDDGTIPLAAGTMLKLPPQKIVQEEITLADLAAAIGVSAERLLETNPFLAQSETVAAGTLIIVPSVEP